MAAKKLSKKALKQPDQFVGFWQVASQRIGRFAAANAKVLVIGTSALATVVAGSVVLATIAEGKAEKASSALNRVQKIAGAELLIPGAPPPKADTSDAIPRFATEKERLEGALKELDAHFGSGHAPLGPEAGLVRGGLLLGLDRPDEAQAVYEKLLGDKLDARLRFLAREGLGYAYERKGKMAEAQATFGKLGTDAGNLGDFYKDRARYHEARLAELQGNPGEAARIYHEVLDKHPTTSLREEISNRLALLELK
ncbi:MAG TPA: tetratricopeptide repeat protein [Polyangia bacterium]|nr:tetratricopeptide repeat protein [Polyangia bacterium]